VQEQDTEVNIWALKLFGSWRLETVALEGGAWFVLTANIIRMKWAREGGGEERTFIK
jgi:hypothetical protein